MGTKNKVLSTKNNNKNSKDYLLMVQRLNRNPEILQKGYV